jgi:hypothetical protein
MKHARTALAASALALGAAALTATEASARPDTEPGSGYTTTPDCHWAYHPVCYEAPVPLPRAEAALDPTPADHNGAETAQTAASALGGAGIVLGAVWIYRRRQAMNG